MEHTSGMSNLARLSLISMATVALAASGSAITWRHDVGDTAYRNFAAVAPHNSVAQVNATSWFGSGTYLGQGNGFHWVLTAGHVTSGTTIQNVRFGSQTITAAGSITHPGYNASTLDFDLGLVRLNSAPTGVAPVRFTTFSSLIGQRVTFAGYGLNGPGNNTGLNFDNNSRAAENIVDFSSGSGGGKFWFTVFTNPNTGTALPLEGSTAGGDSGGGMFWHDGAAWRLAGVTSWGTDTLSRYGDQAAFVALHEHTNWIEQQTGITAVPEPASMLALGAGLLALARRRRKPQA